MWFVYKVACLFEALWNRNWGWSVSAVWIPLFSLLPWSWKRRFGYRDQALGQMCPTQWVMVAGLIWLPCCVSKRG